MMGIVAIILFVMLFALIAITSYIDDRDNRTVRRLLAEDIRKRSNWKELH